MNFKIRSHNNVLTKYLCLFDIKAYLKLNKIDKSLSIYINIYIYTKSYIEVLPLFYLLNLNFKDVIKDVLYLHKSSK